jgi:hypothetical protein
MLPHSLNVGKPSGRAESHANLGKAGRTRKKRRDPSAAGIDIPSFTTLDASAGEDDVECLERWRSYMTKNAKPVPFPILGIPSGVVNFKYLQTG